MAICFEWDEAKNAANWRKHGIRFEEAVHVFKDPLHRSFVERIENGEQRWQTYGMIGTVVLVMIAHTVRDEGDNDVVRLISARYATRKERKRYEQGSD